MNKYLIFAGGFAFGICASLFCVGLQNANAQNSVSAVVGNPGSDNAVVIEETYGIIGEPAGMPQPAAGNTMEPLPDSPGVEVAPPPGQTPENTPDPGSADMEIDEIDEVVETD